MEYTTLIASTFKHNGVPNLGNDSFALLMNIVHLEGKIKAYEQLSKTNKFKYSVEVMKCKEQIQRLTKGLPPKQLIIKLTSRF